MPLQASKYATPAVPATTRSGIPSRLYLHELALCNFPMSWALKPLLPMGSLMLMAGDSKHARKTLTLMHLGQCISTGAPFFGFQPHEPRPVVYSFLEDAHETVGRRAAAIGYAQQAPAAWPVVGTFGQQECYASIAHIGAHAQAGGPAGIWIIDTLAELMRLHGFGDENSSSEMTACLAPYRDFAHYTGWTVIITHHNRKAGDEIRGSGAIKASTDGWLQVQWRPDTAVRQIDGVLREADSFSFGAEIRNIGTIDQPIFRFIAHPSPGWEAGSAPYPGVGGSGGSGGNGGGGGVSSGQGRGGRRGGGSGGAGGGQGQAPPPPPGVPPAPLPIVPYGASPWSTPPDPAPVAAAAAPSSSLAQPPVLAHTSVPVPVPEPPGSIATAPSNVPFWRLVVDVLSVGVSQYGTAGFWSVASLNSALAAYVGNSVNQSTLKRALRSLRDSGYVHFTSYDAIRPGAKLLGEMSQQ